MLNQKALDYIFDVNTKIDAKLSRHFTKLNRCSIVIPPTHQCISRKEQVSPAMRAICTPQADDLGRDGVDRHRRLGHRVYTAKQATGPTTHRLPTVGGIKAG